MKTVIINYYLRMNDYPCKYSLASLRLGEYLNSMNIDIDIFPVFLNSNRIDEIAKELCDKYDIICISHYVWSKDITIDLIKKIKSINSEKEIIIGGPEVIYTNLNDLDGSLLIYGEGEKSLYNCIKYIENGKKDNSFFEDNPNVFTKNKPNYKLVKNELTYINPLFTKFDNIGDEFLYYETSRGCAYNCAYCGFKSRHEVAYFDLDFVKEEIRRIGMLGFKEVFFVDANLGGTKERAKRIMEYFNKYAPDSKLTIYLRPEFIDDEFISILKDSNLKEIRIGIQTLNDNVPNWVRSNSLYHIKEELPKLSNNNIPWKAELIIGLPGDNMVGLKKSIDFVEENLKPTEYCCYPLTIIKGTEMYEYYLQGKINIDKSGMAISSYSYNNDELLDMQEYSKLRMNKYLQANYHDLDLDKKIKRNKVMIKSIE